VTWAEVVKELNTEPRCFGKVALFGSQDWSGQMLARQSAIGDHIALEVGLAEDYRTVTLSRDEAKRLIRWLQREVGDV